MLSSSSIVTCGDSAVKKGGAFLLDMDSEAARQATLPFIEWAAGNPAFYPVVDRALTVMGMALCSPRSSADVVAGRDAAFHLSTYAMDGGFVDAAAWFYRLYELLCCVLLSLVCEVIG